MSSLLVVTYVDFWTKGAGHRTRLCSMINYLKDKVELTVFYTGLVTEVDEIIAYKDFPEINFQFSDKNADLTFEECAEKFKSYIQDKHFDIALIEYLEMSFVLEFLPSSTITILDTHDVIYGKIESFKKYNIEYNGIILNREEEFNIYTFYDYIILIQKKDYENVVKEFDPVRLLLTPHPVFLKKNQIRNKVHNVTYIGSQYAPNIDALKWFLKNVWPYIYKKHDITFNIYGNVYQGFVSNSNNINQGVIFHGFTDNLESVYDNTDLIINPIRCGAGLKIKNVEALGFGLPLVTTTHGASGIEDGVSKAFLIADTPKEFYSKVNSVINNYNLRKQISDNAFEYAKLNFSEEKCYASLLQIINNIGDDAKDI